MISGRCPLLRSQASKTRQGPDKGEMMKTHLKMAFCVAAIFGSALPNLASAQIVALGHSAVAGRVGMSSAWPAQLERILRAKGVNVSVLNAGVYGECTREELARVQTALPSGTRTVILMINGFNDVNRCSGSPADAAKNIAAIKSYIRSRGITLIDAMGIYRSVANRPGTLLDRVHLNVEGHAEVAQILSRMVR